jgi:replicative DNA helicase
MTITEPDQPVDRTPPHDDAAEQVVLGAMLLSPRAIADVIETNLQPRHFYRPANATIYGVILDQYTRNQPTDPVAVASRLAELGELAHIGGAGHLHTCTAAVPTAAMAGAYATTVADRALRRSLIDAGAHVTSLGYDTGGRTATELVERAATALHDATAGATGTDLIPVGDILEHVMQRMETGAQPGLSTGLTDLDRLTRGLLPGQLWIIAARPSMGKSLAATDLARAVALRQRQPVVFFSLEMSREELMERILAAEARVPLYDIQLGGDRLTDIDWVSIAKAAGEIGDAPLHIVDTSALRLTDITARARQLAARGALGLIVVDYLQLMDATSSSRTDNREQQVARISRGLKVLAKDLHVPVVVVAQLNRGPEGRLGHRPMLSDLRESGAIEADADVVILLHRPDYYDKESERAGEVDLIVAKNRSGATDTITAAAQMHFSRFVDMAAEDIYSRVTRMNAA